MAKEGMKEKRRFTRGTKVEVLNMKDPPFGTWRCAEIVSGDGRTYMVRYYTSNSSSVKNTLGRVSHKFVRPYQPLLDISRTWISGEVVEVLDNFSWKMGNVSRALGGNYFLVRLLGLSQVLRVSSSYIRARRSWHNSQWTLIGPGSITFDRMNGSRCREVIDTETGERCESKTDHSKSIVLLPPARPSYESSTSSCSIISSPGCSEPHPPDDILNAAVHSSDAGSSCYGNFHFQRGNKEVCAEVRRLELRAYHCLMDALSASGPLTWEQESLVTNLRMSLHISNDEHLSKLRQLVRGDRGVRVP